MKDYLKNLFAARGAAFWLNLLGLSLAFVIFYVLMAEVKWVHGYDRCYEKSENIYQVFFHWEGENMIQTTSISGAETIAKASPSIEAMGMIYINEDARLKSTETDAQTGHEGLDIQIRTINQGFTEVFTFDMVEGSRALSPDPTDALIPLSFAHKLFGIRESYVGLVCERTEEGKKQGQLIKVKGVYRDFPDNAHVKNACYMAASSDWYSRNVKERGSWSYLCYVRLYPGSNTEFMKQVFANNLGQFGFTGDENSAEQKNELAQRMHFRLIQLHDVYYLPKADGGWGGTPYLEVFYAALSVLVLLIAAINYLNFSLAQIPRRIKEINIRKILGASMRSLRLLYLGRILVTVSLAIILAFGAVWFIMQKGYLNNLLHCDLSFDKNLPILCLLLSAAVVIVLGSGLYPTWYSTSRKPALVIKGDFTFSPRGRDLRKGLIGTQFSISLATILLLLLMYAQHYYINTGSVGYARDQLFYISMDEDFRKKESSEMLYRRLSEHPDVSDITRCSQCFGEYDKGHSIYIFGTEYLNRLGGMNVASFSITENFLETMGIPLMRGVGFAKDKENSIIVNQSLCDEAGVDLDSMINVGGKSKIIAGVIPNIQHSTMRVSVEPMLLSVAQSGNLPILAIRVGDSKKLTHVSRYAEDLICELVTNQDECKVITNKDIVEKAYGEEENQMTLVLIGSIVSLLISLIGVFGLVLFETQARRKEVGIRKVFGATTKRILVMFNWEYLRILVVCFVIAAPVAYSLYERWIETFAYRTPMHWWLFGVAFLLVAAVICLTVTVQSWRAAKERPVDTIMK